MALVFEWGNCKLWKEDSKFLLKCGCCSEIVSMDRTADTLIVDMTISCRNLTLMSRYAHFLELKFIKLLKTPKTKTDVEIATSFGFSPETFTAKVSEFSVTHFTWFSSVDLSSLLPEKNRTSRSLAEVIVGPSNSLMLNISSAAICIVFTDTENPMVKPELWAGMSGSVVKSNFYHCPDIRNIPSLVQWVSLC